MPHLVPVIRDLTPGDNMELLTELIHAAYAPHAAKGLRYWGTHQSVQDTAARFASGHGLVAESNGAYLGTITVRPPQSASEVALYRDPTTCDTAAPAHALIAMYEAWGYKVVGACDWRPDTNYTSVVMSLAL